MSRLRQSKAAVHVAHWIPEVTHLPLTPRLKAQLASVLVGCLCSAAVVSGEPITVLAQFQDQKLRVIESSGVAAPRHHAGFYVEWANEMDFLERQKLVEGATYRITGHVDRSEVRRFPVGWGERSGRPYSTLYVRAESAVRTEEKK